MLTDPVSAPDESSIVLDAHAACMERISEFWVQMSVRNIRY